MPRGGYRKPNNPAPVSGPGALSRRTDGGPGSKQAQQEIRTGKYGESKKIMEQQQGAPMAGSPTPNPDVAVQQQPQPQQVVGPVQQLFAPTNRPTEPVTAGMTFGPGMSTPPMVQSFNQPADQAYQLTNALAPLLEYDRTGKIKMLYDIAVKRGW